MRRVLIIVGGLALVAGVACVFWPGGSEAVSWRLAQVAKTDVKATVSATGALETVTLVEVGTQVSGTLEEVLVDFNDRVEQGQVLARLDTSILEADVASAGATLAIRSAEEERAANALVRAEKLHPKGVITDAEIEQARTQAAVAKAQVRAASVSLSRARQNLGYATITSPISGTIIERAVEQGQTVNAGMSAPKLFVLAGDLTHMQIVASVDESDIGLIQPDQRVSFSVQAFQRETFEGKVRQVRLQSAIEENVVTYKVVIDVNNPDQKLLPGMTATVEFIVQEANDVFCVPNAALRFRPEPEQIDGDPPTGGGGWRGAQTGSLWVPSGDKVEARPVSLGIRSGRCTEVRGEGISEGMSVVTGVTLAEADEGGVTNPFQQGRSGRRSRGGF